MDDEWSDDDCDPDYHPSGCMCDECEDERAWDNCGHVAGEGCSKAGSEWCDWKCPLRRSIRKQSEA